MSDLDHNQQRLEAGREYLADYMYDEDWHGEESASWFEALGDLVSGLPLDDPLVGRATSFLRPFLDNDSRIDGAMYPAGEAVSFIEEGWGDDLRLYVEGFVEALGRDHDRWRLEGADLDQAPPVLEWVSKTDVTTYLRCPYTYSLLYRGELQRPEIFGDADGTMLLKGVKFEEMVDAKAEATVEPIDLQATLDAGGTVLDTSIFLNEALGLFGIPDGIEGPDYLPIEIKGHRDVKASDRIELAFYWLLLTPHRRDKERKPCGVLILPEGEGERRVEVELSEKDIAAAVNLVDAVRAARTTPVPPQVCDCHVCTVVRGDDVRRETRLRRHPTLIFDVSRSRASTLSQIGIETYDDLLRHPAQWIASEFWLDDPKVSAAAVVRWQQHARAYQLGLPLRFGEALELPNSYVVLDLEYLTYPHDRIWLAGFGRVEDGVLAEVQQFWADDNDDAEKSLLLAVNSWLESLSSPLLVTWNGKSADFPQMRRAAKRLGIADPLASRVSLDVFAWARASLRLPIPSLSLKPATRYFELSQELGAISDGFDAAIAYQVLSSGSTDEASRQALLDYNRADLSDTTSLVETLRSLPPAPDLQTGNEPVPKAGPEPVVLEWADLEL